VKENVEVVPKLLDWKAEKRKARTEELLDLLGLEPSAFQGRYPSELSGGQQQRVGIARALAANPELLLFDEPFSALDPITRADLQEEVLRLKEKLHKTTVFVTHDIREAFLLGDVVVILNEGKIVQAGTPAEIESHPANEFVERFIHPSNA
jgi:osmoprotectant transport system ATP-binding protein